MKRSFLTFALLLALSTLGFGAPKKITMIAGKPSHGPGQHEHNAGVLLLAKCLQESGLPVEVKTHLNAEWPSAEEMAAADTILIYSDGGGGHPALQGDHLAQLEKEMKRGSGFVCLHYAVETPITPGGKEFTDWLGGYFEPNWSVNPHWQADFTKLPEHPISNGVKPFSTNDEWYFHMRFRGGMKGVTPILTAIAPESTMSRKDGPHSGNPAVREEVKNKVPQHTAWAVQRDDGGRGFGFTGGHFHAGWGNDDQRKLVLNAILWTAKGDVPAEGVTSKVSEVDLKANLDDKPAKKPAAAPASKPAAAAPAPANAGASSGVKPIFRQLVSKATGAVPVSVDLKGAKELYLVVHEGPDGIGADWTDWAEPMLVLAGGKKQKLTDLKMKVSTTGWGGVVLNRNAAGLDMAIEGFVPKASSGRLTGIGTHSNSVIGFDLPEGVERLEAHVGLDAGGTKQSASNKVEAMVFTSTPPTFLTKSGGSGEGEKAYGYEAANDQMMNFKTPDGLEATLFAAEPQIQNPTNLDIDPSGRIWGLEAVNYRSSMKPWGVLRPEGDRVVILADTNGDGKADKETTFYQNKDLTNPLGICVLPQNKGTKVLVSASPNLWLLTDADGDDKAEKAEILLKVGGNFDHDHNLHAVVFGPDGKFYFNFGNEGRALLHADGKPVVDIAGNEINDKGAPYRQGMIFRCDIDLEKGVVGKVETLAHNFRNNYEVCVDAFGGMWQSDNDDDGNKGVRINAIVDYGSYGYTDEITGAGWRSERTNIEEDIPLRHWHQNDPGTIPNLIVTGSGSPTGILINESPLLGKTFENQLIHCDAGPRTVRSYPSKKAGAGYTAEMVDVLTTEDTWYRPSDVCIAPDGSLFITDWYDPGVGGHNMGDNIAGKIRGRVYRVAPKGHAYKVSAPDFTSAAGCVEALKSPNSSTRYVAWSKLQQEASKSADALKALTESSNARQRARGLHLLLHGYAPFEETLTKLLKDKSEDIRVMAVRELRLAAVDGKLPESISKDLSTWLLPLVKAEESKQVLREYAITLHIAKDPASFDAKAGGDDSFAKTWQALAEKHDGKDRWYLEALGIGSAGREDRALKAWIASVGEKWNTPAGRDIVWRIRSTDAIKYLVNLITLRAIDENEVARYLRSFDFLPASAVKDTALVQIAISGTRKTSLTADVLKRLGSTPWKDKPEVTEAMNKVLNQVKGTPEFIDVVQDFGLKGRDKDVLKAALADPRDPRALHAVKILLGSKEGSELLVTTLAESDASALISLLGGSGDKAAIKLLSGVLTDSKQDAAVRGAAVKALSLSAPGAEAILELIDGGKFPEDMKSNAGTALSMVQYPGISERAAKALPAPSIAGGKSLPPISELIKLKGDVEKGRAIFAKAESTCILCHRVGSTGVDFAPALSEIGSKLGKDALYESLLNPNAGVSMGFETWSITMENGQTAMGIIRSETGDQLVLAMPGGVANSYVKRQIKTRQKLPASMMPAGLQAMFSQEDLVNLIEYLSSLKAPKP